MISHTLNSHFEIVLDYSFNCIGILNLLIKITTFCCSQINQLYARDLTSGISVIPRHKCCYSHSINEFLLIDA